MIDSKLKPGDFVVVQSLYSYSSEESFVKIIDVYAAGETCPILNTSKSYRPFKEPQYLISRNGSAYPFPSPQRTFDPLVIRLATLAEKVLFCK